MMDKAAKKLPSETSNGNGATNAMLPSDTVPSQPGAVEPMMPAGVNACWSCRGPVMAGDLFCSTCEAVQPPRPLDHFARLDLEPGFEIPSEELDRHYFDLQRKLHPDRFATKTSRERAISIALAADINTAYETLQDPVKRAITLLEMQGMTIHADGCNTMSDPVLLMEAMEQREALAEAKSLDAVEGIATVAGGEKANCLAELADAFGKNDLSTADRLTTRLKYLIKFEDELRTARARHSQAP